MKKILALILALVMVFALVACGTTAAPAATEEPKTEEPAAEEGKVYNVAYLVNGNLGAGVAVSGAFGLVRFRSAPGNAKDISVIFVAMAVGLACGSGYIALSVLFTVIACAVLYLLVFFHIGADRSGEKELSITIPESLDYTEVFDDIFKEYTTHAELTEVKTASLGSLYKLHYRVRLADDRNEKEFLDALRCRNGNLEVRCGQPHTPVEQL